uniref:Uncharacterized protein LOC114338990 n=1 Tax=Diabrotica virgifera virgifera TaxID=50390 RepID=A0A6P7GJN4_DIAVI
MSTIVRLFCIVVFSYSILSTTSYKIRKEHLGYGVRSFLSDILRDPVGKIKKVISNFGIRNPLINSLLKGVENLQSGQGISGFLKIFIKGFISKLEAVYDILIPSGRDIFEILRLGTMDTLKEYTNSTTLESYNKVVYGVFDFMRQGIKSAKVHLLHL